MEVVGRSVATIMGRVLAGRSSGGFLAGSTRDGVPPSTLKCLRRATGSQPKIPHVVMSQITTLERTNTNSEAPKVAAKDGSLAWARPVSVYRRDVQ